MSFYPNKIDNFIEKLNKYKIDLTKYVPTFISEISEMKAIYDVQGTELGSLLYYSKDLLNQFFINTATWGLIYWEDEYGIDTNLNMNYEDRRTVLKAKKRGQGTTTKEMIKNVAESFSGGEVNIIENNANYSFIVKFIGIKGIPKNMEAFKNMLEDIKPAHLGYVFEYTYTVWNVLKEKNLTWISSEVKTWDELKVY
ncbi:hypothetical protein psyc5s11_55010 [Clostridium gelidum]|uniref:Phage portal protein n=1 Tax=Clostridium gelidum TaxID=704125 RepID=A0ABN6J570_9CLOT|nr:YmfQ family protein [Clostridium gelidum]BCZ49434.1 hypothetical protein psyc5s11_55010 [Clostridium gelidum]